MNERARIPREAPRADRVITRSDGYHSALASASRRKVLDALSAAEAPLDVRAIADELGLHVTTARFHLDQLAAAGLVERRVEPAERRGRPRLLYAPTSSDHEGDARDQLIQVLSAALALDADADADASDAGRRWGHMITAPDVVEPVPRLVEVFERLGFAPEPDDDTATIRLRGCPFRTAARSHPQVICAVHRGLIDQLLDGSGSEARLIPFVEPELCLVALNGLPMATARV